MTCNFCGSVVKDDAIYCPNCGEKPNTKKKNTVKEKKHEENKEEKVSETTTNSDYSFLWGILGYFVPIAGLVLFIIWKDSKPKDSKAAGIGALVRACLMLFAFIIMVFMMIFSTIMDL